MTYQLTRDAQNDLIGIRRYTLQTWGGNQSEKYLDTLHQLMLLLVTTPEMGTLRPELGDDIRAFPCQSHMIYYTMAEGILTVFAVLHQQMLPQKHMAHRR